MPTLPLPGLPSTLRSSTEAPADPRPLVGQLRRAARDLPGRLAAVLTWPAPDGAYRRMLDPLAPGTGVRAVVEAVIPETARAATVVIRPGPGWQAHRPGQWVSVGVDVDGVRHHRCYSITSLPGATTSGAATGAPRITITVQAVPDGIVSSHLVQRALPGDVVHLDGPDGDFTLPPADATDGAPADDAPLLMITGGSGVTPVMGMLRALDAGIEGELRDVVVVHHAPDESEMLFADDLRAIARRRPGLGLHLVTTGAGAPPPHLELTESRLDELCPDWRDREAWVCGPRPLVDAVTALWDDPTVGTTAPMHVERFAPVLPSDGDRVGGTITFTRSERSAESDGSATVLDVAESIGLAPISGCRMGVCRRCVVPLRSGTVRDLRDGRTECEPGTHVQICVSAPVGDAEIEL